jgi:chromosome segregation ATPase
MSVKASPSEGQATIAVDEFHALEEKVYRTIELLKSARESKTAAEQTALRLREQLDTAEEQAETLRTELVAIKKEREEVRGRVEKILKQIDQLTDADSQA